jgi:hypothetical protein
MRLESLTASGFHRKDTVDMKEDLPSESKISKILSERTTRMVIIIILCMLFCMPLF